jgi:hypothetical protein
MTEERWLRIRAICDELDPLSADEQARQLDRLCDGDLELRSSVLRLYAPEETAADPIMDLVVREFSELAKPEPAQSRFGRYEVVRHVGSGGMGAVYEAVRVDDFHKRVALKVIRQEFDSEFARQRFQQERQVLATLEHPCIARLLDGGETPEGSPYLVLEFVDGLAIDDYCEKLDRRAILGIFVQMCRAVEYAHRNLIVHRDLKPANILVTASGEPKLLDFGIAKLIDPTGLNSQTTLAALTPQYASPEQVRGLPVTTATDIYSLGVILYKLLTGNLPYVVEGASALEMDRQICEKPPAPPGLGNELDYILLMCLRKEPERRYATVAQLAEDLGRFLSYRTVSARPDTLRYRTAKFVRRSWLALTAVAAVIVALGIGAGVAAYQARISSDRFEDVRQLAHRFVFDYSDDLTKIQGTTEIRKRMAATALQYLDRLSRDAGNDGGLLRELAAGYQKVGNAQGFPTLPNLGDATAAVASYQKAEALYARALEKHPEYRKEAADFRVMFAHLLENQSDIPGATAQIQAATRDFEDLSRAAPGDIALKVQLAQSYCIVGDIESAQGLQAGALPWFRKCEGLGRDILAQKHGGFSTMTGILSRVGDAAQQNGYLDEALRAFQEQDAMLQQFLKRYPGNVYLVRTATVGNESLSELYGSDDSPSLENRAEALTYARRYLDGARGMLTKDPKNSSAQLSYAIALFRLSFFLRSSDPAGAVAAAREAVQWFNEQPLEKAGYVVASRRTRALRRYAEALLAAGKLGEARSVAAQAIEAQRGILHSSQGNPGESARLALILATAADIELAFKDPATAFRFASEAEQIGGKVYEQHPDEMAFLIAMYEIRQRLSAIERLLGHAPAADGWRQAAGQVWRTAPRDNPYVQARLARIG